MFGLITLASASDELAAGNTGAALLSRPAVASAAKCEGRVKSPITGYKVPGSNQ